MKKVMYLIGLITSICMSVGWTFTILHWPGGSELVTYGFLGFGLLFVPLVVVNYFKVNIKGGMFEKLKIIFGLASGVTVALAVIFKLLHLQGADILLLGGCFLFSFLFLPFLFFSKYKKSVS